MYLICEAHPLSDQWECEAEIIPVRVVRNLETFLFDRNKYYEIWKILPNGSLILVKDLEGEI